MNRDQLPPSVTTIDCHYELDQRAAAYLIVEGGRAAFVDNNTVFAVPHLLAALAGAGLAPEQVDYAIVTHLHLDHAGGTAELLKHCPNATVLAHPKAARHLADPSRLVAGVQAVYGEEAFARLYGVIEPIPEGRIRAVADGEEIAWGGRSFRFLHTLGHASHHVCILDTGANAIFTGDTFGVSRNAFVRPGPGFVAASAAPAEFAPREARESVQAILDTGASVVYPTHYDGIPNVAEASEQLLRSIGQMGAILNGAVARPLAGADLVAWCQDQVRVAMMDHLAWCRVMSPEDDLQWLEGDIKLNGQGIAMVAQRLRG